MKIHPHSSFSLTDLLVAICILVIVATIAVPLLSNIQAQAQDTVALQIQSQLNATYANWKDSGGVETPANNGSPTGITYTSDLLAVIGAPPGSTPRNSPNNSVCDGGSSNMIGCTLPPGAIAAIQQATVTGNPSAIVTANDHTIVFTGSTFRVIPNKTINNPSGSGWYQQQPYVFSMPMLGYPGQLSSAYFDIFYYPTPGLSYIAASGYYSPWNFFYSVKFSYDPNPTLNSGFYWDTVTVQESDLFL